MAFLPAKVKIGLLILIAGAVIVALYWILVKTKQKNSASQRNVFAVPTERIRKKVLENGMQVVVFQNKSLPKVLVQIAYDVGSYVEGSGERGLAHLIEHMIFKGTNTFSESDIDAIARKYGAHFNASTSLDVTTYYFETNKNNWKPFFGSSGRLHGKCPI